MFDMRAAPFRLLVLATAVAGLASLPSLAEPPRPYPPPHAYPPPSPYPPPPPYPGPVLPKDPFGNLLSIPLPYPDAQTRALLLDGADKLLRALDRMIQTVPVYDPPVLTPEGDILLRRRPPAAPPPVPQRAPPPSPWPSFPPAPSVKPPLERTAV